MLLNEDCSLLWQSVVFCFLVGLSTKAGRKYSRPAFCILAFWDSQIGLLLWVGVGVGVAGEFDVALG